MVCCVESVHNDGKWRSEERSCEVPVAVDSVAGKGGQRAVAFCVNIRMRAQLTERRLARGKAIGAIESLKYAAHKDVVSSGRHYSCARICHFQ